MAAGRRSDLSIEPTLRANSDPPVGGGDPFLLCAEYTQERWVLIRDLSVAKAEVERLCALLDAHKVRERDVVELPSAELGRTSEND